MLHRHAIEWPVMNARSDPPVRRVMTLSACSTRCAIRRCYPHPVQPRPYHRDPHFVHRSDGHFRLQDQEAVDLGFLDFTTLRKKTAVTATRNSDSTPGSRRTSISMSSPISGTPEVPRVGGGGTVIEYAVRMREFPQEAWLDRVLARGELGTAPYRRTGRTSSRFHAGGAVFWRQPTDTAAAETLALALKTFARFVLFRYRRRSRSLSPRSRPAPTGARAPARSRQFAARPPAGCASAMAIFTSAISC